MRLLSAMLALVILAWPGSLAAHAQDRPLFTAHTDLVVLHVSVRDGRGAYVTDLADDAFGVVEEGRVQTIQFVLDADTPATVGLVIDDSISMLPHREIVLAAADAFAAASHPDDEFFALAFNEQVRPALPQDAPFTGDRRLLRDALDRSIRTRGRTALYDAIASGLDYAARGSRERQVLVVVSDGSDNASRMTLDDVVARAQRSNTVVYTIALADPVTREADPAVLGTIARATGGEAFRVNRPNEMDRILAGIARDIRHAYTIGYAPAEAVRDGSLRRLRVVVTPPEGDRLVVRTRSSYRAGIAR